jgi:hypothetical protein
LVAQKFRQKVRIDAQTSENVQNLDLLQKNAFILPTMRYAIPRTMISATAKTRVKQRMLQE